MNNIFRVDQIVQGCVQMSLDIQGHRMDDEVLPFSLDAGPFQLLRDFPAEDRVYRGRPRIFRFDHALAYAGNMQSKLIQPTAGPSIFSEFLETRGEGLHHVGFLVKPHEYADAVEAITRNGSRHTPGRRFPSINFRHLIN